MGKVINVMRPGLPAIIPIEGNLGTEFRGVDGEGRATLWTLSYIRSNSVKTQILKFSEPIDIGSAVESAKRYCKSRNVSFSWLEPTIVELEATQIGE